MGRWILECPSCGKYEGECHYRRERGRFILECSSLRSLRESFLPYVPEEESLIKAKSRSPIDMVFEKLDQVYASLGGIVGLTGRDINESVTPEVVGTAAEVLTDIILSPAAGAMADFLIGLGLFGGSAIAKDRMSGMDRKIAIETSAHMMSRLGRLLIPGEMKMTLEDARSLGEAMSSLGPSEAVKKAVKPLAALKAEFEDLKATLGGITLAPPAPPAVPPPPTPPVTPPPVELVRVDKETGEEIQPTEVVRVD